MGLKDFIKTDHTEDELFLLGLFSLLDALLDQPMEDIVDIIPLDESIKDTLIGRQSPLLPYLKIIEKQERGEWKELMELLDKLKISTDIVSGAYSNALTETDKLFKLSNN